MVESKKIYLDSCIFVACFTNESSKIDKINDFFNQTKNINNKFCTSDWTLTEIVKVLIKDKKITSKKVAEYIQELKRTKRVGGIKFEWLIILSGWDSKYTETTRR